MKRRFVGLALCAFLLGDLAAGAGAAPLRPTATLMANKAAIGAAGGRVILSLRVRHGVRCTFRSRPRLAGLGKSVRCATATVKRTVQIPANPLGMPRTFVVSAQVTGTNGIVNLSTTVHERGRRNSGKAPVNGSSSLSNGTPIGTGGQVVAAGARSWWVPPVHAEWQWELDHPFSTTSAADLGQGAVTYTGAPSPTPSIYDIDGFDNPATTVSALHALGDRVICYIEVGAAERYRGDYSAFPPAALGNAMSGYPAERYLNINDPAVVAVIEARIKMCATKGFDAVEPDIDDSYAERTGFPISEAQQITYDSTLASYAHGLGLGWGLKNGDGADGFASAMLAKVDFVLDEQCFQYRSCSAFSPSFANAGKAVFEVEYSDQGGPGAASFCPTAMSKNFNAVEFDSNLDGRVRVPCS